VLAALEKIKASFDAHCARQEGLACGPDRARGQRACRAGRKSRGFTSSAVPPGPHGRVSGSNGRRIVLALEPAADGFRNYYGKDQSSAGEYLLVDKANLLTLSAPEMTVLVGGLRVLGANWDKSSYGVFTATPGALTNDFFVNLLELGTTWKPLDPGSHAFSGTDDATGQARWKGTRADLLFGSNSELRRARGGLRERRREEKFVHDFTKAWTKVTELDRFDLA
jgi:catalase-peroxidase